MVEPNGWRGSIPETSVTEGRPSARPRRGAPPIRRRWHGSRTSTEPSTVGLYAENPPEGFGFSDTAFRIFILMASRRLQSDRFLTVDFRPEVYTPLGMDWIERNGMKSAILRHCPELAGFLPRTASAFVPWRPITPEEHVPGTGHD